MTKPDHVTTRIDTFLLSDASPEDNEFTLWLALQLSNEGCQPFGFRSTDSEFGERLLVDEICRRRKWDLPEGRSEDSRFC